VDATPKTAKEQEGFRMEEIDRTAYTLSIQFCAEPFVMAAGGRDEGQAAHLSGSGSGSGVRPSILDIVFSIRHPSSILPYFTEHVS